ncbi:MAG: M20/M25/M40 family metallo-hydrolase [Hymenobacteraceae bacterium]|nr:M20/M25/M40 family metallo-hydrolase [Hymenobacteraceae bacterium]MDX5396802.1 M20/M25/M40 family metallo-hydrolase [Hymenobacteraceae bacterium]MDX5443485.1 M20/M25/M40 family metallo-hydrolase [Hymenobacteraceae bacterium]MDX5512870.1 M20/M25/M40 family metallo-hydrolase [Hymenobacteraceae bacterium]
MNTELLKTLCHIHAPSGNEVQMKEFLLDYIKQNQKNWKVQPQLVYGDEFQDNLMLVFGKPRTAIFAHMDSIGFMVRYGKQLVKIGGPRIKSGYELVGEDSGGKIECTLQVSEDEDEPHLQYEFDWEIDRGAELVFKPNFRETDETVQCCYMDNRLGVWSALQVAETLENGIIVFGCWEEVGGGAVRYLAKHIYEQYGVRQALVSDITWVTEGVKAGEGVAISLRDSLLPRRSFVKKIIEIAKEADIPFQIEVEEAGGSDGKELQHSDIPWDWCFVGAPEDNVHSPDEIVHKADIKAMVDLYKVLMVKL